MGRLIPLILAVLMLLPASLPGALKEGQLDYGYIGDDPPGKCVNETRPRTVELLGSAFLAGETVPRRVELVRDIGECRLPEGLPYIRAAMGEDDVMVRGEAARAAGLIADAGILPDLRKLADDPAASVRREVYVAAGILKDEAIVLKGLGEEDPAVLAAAMGVAFAPAHAAKIAQRLPGLSPALQVQAMEALGRLEATDHAAAVAPFLDKSIPLKIAAAEALGRMKSTAHGQAVQALLADPHPTVRRAALDALEGVAPVDVRQQRAIERLEDVDLSVRLAAVAILHRHPTPAGVEPLVKQLDVQDHQPLHDAARDALVAAGDAAIPAAGKLLYHENPQRRVDGLFILAELKSDHEFDRQMALMKDESFAVVAAAARSLGNAGRKEAIPLVAALAAEGVKPLDADRMRKDAANWLDSVTQAIVACGKLGHGEIFNTLRPILPQYETMPSAWRGATVWVYGVTANDGSAVGSMMGIIGNERDSESVKYEVVKMLGNLPHKASEGYLAKWNSDRNLSMSPRMRQIAHWAYQRVSGKTVPYEPIEEAWRADVSISDLSQEQQ